MKIGVIGGGAAGMMCSATINESHPDAEVLLFEKNFELGKKVIISGGGRSNVTTGFHDIKTVLEKYPRGSKFLQSALHTFSPTDAGEWFEAHGVPLICEDDLRVFPQSHDGHDIVDAFKKIFKTSHTKILTGHGVQRIEKNSAGGFKIFCKDKEIFLVDKVVLCLGGQAYRHTGSTGDGYALAESLGHSVTRLAPSLNSFIIKEKWPKTLSGLSFKKATIKSVRNKKHSYTGPFLFTHTGVSGPAVFALSSLTAFEEYSPKKPLEISIDLCADFSVDELTMHLTKLMQESPKKTCRNTIHAILPRSLADFVCETQNISTEKKNAEIRKKVLNQIVDYIKNIPLSVIGRGAGDEFVTAGGVELSEVNPSTMESKICPGLFFAGEILNVDGFTGGFNLHASWATGRRAGLHVY
ncbi:MAG: NAD(P)/FAD-dependent oxidoreductase [Candidatus Magasanikbacteria bacterium]|nr:NAD(P)/FAD-dependent oxidoreductase [Candidatus Magasanikbacteria bacterium]